MARLIGNVDATGSLSTSVSAPATNASAVSLYLPFDTNVNDASGNGFTVTANNGAAVSSAQAKFNSSLALDGTNDYLTVASGSEFQTFNSAPFTIEGFFYCTENTTSDFQIIMSTGTGSNNWNIAIRPSDKRFQLYDGTARSTDAAWSVNTWHHFAVCFDGTTLRQFIDGVQIRSESYSNLTSANTNIDIGRHAAASNYFTGYLDDIRITKSVALYTQNFVPPSQAVGASLSGTNETNSTTDFTSLKLNLDSNFTDTGPSGHSMTANGNTQISTAQKKFGAGSALFDGNGDYLSTPASSDFAISSGDFTVSLWYYPISEGPTNGDPHYSRVFNFGNYWNNTDAVVLMDRPVSGNGKFVFQAYSISQVYHMYSTTSVSNGQWYHLQVCRSGSTLYLFVNGNLEDTYTTSVAITTSANVAFHLAGAPGGSGAEWSNSYIDDVLVLKGYALNTSSFTPPTSPLTTTVSQTRNDLAVLYLPFDDGLEDKARNHAVTANGDAAISATQAKFGGKSLYLDGTGDYLTIPNSGDFNFKGEDFSIEAWVYPTALNSNQGIFSKWGANGSKSIKLVVDSSGDVSLQGSKDGSTGTQVNVTASTSISLNTWAHVAATRSGDVYTVYINGTASGTQTVSGDLYESSSDVGIGANRADQNTNLFTGYIDDLLCVVGFAKTYGSAPSAASGGQVLDVATDTRTFSSVWNLNSAEVTEAFKAGTWPS